MARKHVIYFATSNKEKFAEVVEILRGYPIIVERIDMKGKEIQSDSLEQIAEESATNAASRTNLPVFVEDTGLFIQHLRGFPGAYAAYVYRTIGLRGILKLMEDAPTRDAYFRSAIAFASPRHPTITFVGQVLGRITTSIRGTNGLGYDPVFEPYEEGKRTFGEMTIQEKNKFSHRSAAVKKLVEWYIPREVHSNA